MATLQAFGRTAFSLAILMRVAALAIAPRPPATIARARDADLPRYSLILPLYREAEVVAGLVRAIQRLDYPADRLQVLFALEPDDAATRAAVSRHAPRGWRTVLAPAQGPRTKPNACNAALTAADGEIVVIFDAEDRPHPMQLREAAARFAAGPASLACLQAPLRVSRGAGFLRRQFALEYAALFEVTTPALARLGLAFPLGGTSNHFKRATLEGLGGWDPFNVTEDADIGLRLGAAGGRIGMLTHPTWEPAPPSLQVWTPQRTRWVKGHMHTWLVHMRRPWRGGLRAFLTLQITLGLNVATALLHGPMAMGLIASLMIGAAGQARPIIAPFDAGLLLAGWASAAAAMAVGARRAGFPCQVKDLVLAPVYWPLQSLAGVFAVYELAVSPHRWNKTPHTAQDEAEEPAPALARSSAL